MKGTRFTKFISLLLSVMMVLTLLPSSALAEVTEEPSTETPVVTNGDETEEGTGEDPVVKYTVNFYVGKELVETQEVAEGGFAKRPDDPDVSAADAAEGMSFLYWYAKNKNSKFIFETPIKEDLDLHALFGVAEEPAKEPAEVPAEEPSAKSSAPGSVLPDSTFLKTYTFMVDEAQYGDTQTVATGDTLFEPAAPTAPAGMRFVGWFDSGNAQFTSFGTQTVEASGDITLTAVFASAYYAFFYNAAGTAIIETRAPGTDNLVSTTNVTALQIAVDEALIGWSLTPGGSTVGSTVTVSGANVNLYPIIQKVKWISFNSNGGTYVSPMYVAPNTVLTSDLVNAHVDSQVEGTQITKPGYTFNSWTGFPFGSAVTSDVTLNANWTAGTANYTIVYLVENSDDTEYSYYSHTVVAATSGSTIASVAHPNITGCTYLSQDLSSNNIVKGDGTTVITVKYSRNSYEVKFYKITGYDWWGNPTYAVDTTKTINAKYGAYIGDRWPLDNGGNRLPYKVTQNGSTMQSGLEIMPLNGKSFWAVNQDGDHTYKLYYYVETLNASDPYVATYNGRFYKLHHIDSLKADGLQSTPDDHYDILGFTYTNNITYSGGYAEFDSNHEIKFFYNRNIWTLQFYNYNAVDTAHTDTNVKFETDISGRNFTPSLPTGLPTNYVFMGWFTTVTCVAGSAYSFTGKTMPNKNVILYAKWAPPSFTGLAHLTVQGTDTGYDLGTIPYGGTISSSALTTARNMADANKPHPTDTFGGWLIERNGSRTLFNASMQIYANVVLYPQWISGVSYHVTYNLNGASAGTAPSDGTAYGEGAQAQVLAYDASVVPPTGMVFVGWLGSDGHIYYPGSAITVTGDMTLTAQWSSSASAVTLTYNGNGGKRSDDSGAYDITAKNNSRHTVESNTFTNTGKNFVKWNTKPDGSGTDYLEGASVLLGASQPTSPTTLYAIWEAVVYYTITVTVNPPEGIESYDGDGTYPASTNAHFIHWRLAEGYYITSVYDNGVLVDPIEYSGNKLQIHKIDMDHEIIINLAPTSYTLTYNGNGGTYSGGTTSSSTLAIGAQYIVPANFFTNTGFYFLGWSTSSSATTADPAYAPGTTHNMPAANVTLYAVWAAKTNLVLTANSAALNYSGSAQSVSGFTGNVSGLTYGGTTTAGVSETAPGQYTAAFTNTSGLVITQSGTDVTERYNVSFVPGTLTINPKVSYIIGATGAEYAYEWVTYGTGDATYSITPVQNITVGTTHYYWTGTWDIPAANNLTANTTITALYSQNKTLTITGDSDTVTYNGSEQEITTATLSDPTLIVTGYTVSGKGIDADDYDVIVTLGTDFKIMSGSTDVTYQYDVSTPKGKLTILPATLTVTANDENFVYPQTRTAEASLGYTVTSGLVGTQTAGFNGFLAYKDGFATQPLPGSYANAIEQGSLALVDNGTFLAANYTLSFVKGNVNVSSGTFSVSLTDASAVYNGSAHSATLNGTQSGDDIQYFVKQGGVWVPASSTPSVTNVTDGPKDIKVIVSRTGYNNAEAFATLTITPATLTVSAVDKTITYPANRPAEATLNYTVSGEIGSEEAAFTGLLAYETGLAVQPAAGPYHDVIEQGSLLMADNGTFKASNYSLSFVKGDLSVLAGTFTPTSDGYTGTYDGTPHGLTADVPGVTGETIWYGTSQDNLNSTTPPTFTDAGTYTVYFAATDPAGNYNDSSVQSGTVTILPATLTVTAVDKEITYPANRPAEATLNYTVSGEIGSEEAAFTGELAYLTGFAVQPAAGPHDEVIVQGSLLMADNGTFKASNYSLSFNKGDLTVLKGTMIPYTDGYLGTYDGDPHGLTAQVDGVSGATILYSTTPFGPFSETPPTFTDAGTYDVFYKAIDPAGNYNESDLYIGQVTINRATLTVTANDKTITYPANRPLESALDYTVSGEIGLEEAAFTGELAYLSSLAVQPAAGPHDEVIVQGSLLMADNGTFKTSNYSLSFVKGDLTVLAGTFTPTTAGYLGTYDGDPHGLTADVPGVDGEVIYYSTSPDGPFDSTTPPTFTDAGTYTVYFIATDPAGNYNNSSVQSGTVTILPKTLTVTANDKSITYPAARPDEAALDYVVSGEIGSEEAAFTGILGYVSTLGTNPLPGPYDEVIVQGYLALADNGTFKASNYSIDFVEGDLNVASGTFSVSLTDASAAYSGSAHYATLNGALDDDYVQYFVNEGDVWLPISYTPSVTNVTDGPKEIKVLVSREGYNDAEATATLTITPVEVTVTAKDRSMTYGDTTTLTPAEGVTYAGFVNSETSSVVSGTGSITYAYADGGTAVTVDNDLAVGSYSITPDVSGLTATNYTFKAKDGTLAVGIATMTVDSLGYTGVYDGNPHDLVAEASVSGMTITYSTSPTGTFTSSSPEYTDAGTYTVYFKAIDPDGNYADATGSAQIKISKAVITGTANNQSMTYGDSAATPAAGVSYSGFALGEDESVISGTAGFNYYNGSTEVFIGSTLGAGGYTITPDLSGLTAANYTFTPANGTLTVNKAVVTVTAENKIRTYGDTAPADESAAFTGFVNGENIITAGVTGAVTYEYFNGLTEVTVDQYLGAGSYSIVPGVGGLSSANYTFAPANGDLTVSQKLLTVVPDDRSMTYGDTTTLTPAEGVTYQGFVNGDTAATAGISGDVYYSYMNGLTPVTVNNTLPVKTYTIVPDIDDLLSDNYSFTQGSGTLTVNKATMTVGSTGYSGLYSGTPHDLLATASVPGMTITYSTSADGTFSPICPSYTNVGTYTIYFKAVDPAGNYVTATGHADIDIDQRMITATANDQSMTYGDTGTLTAAGVTYTGFVDGENETNIGLTGSVGYGYRDATNWVSVNNTLAAGTYTIVPNVTGLSAPNYYFAPAAGTLNVNKKLVTVTADDRSMTYGDTTTLTPAEGVAYTGFANGDTESVVSGKDSITYTYKDGATTVTVNNTLETGEYSIVPGVSGLSADNYTFTPANGKLTVNVATMEVESDGYDGLYDGAPHGLTAAVDGMPGMTITYSDSATGTFTSASPEYTDAGTYTVYFKAVDPYGNYADATGSAEIVIRKVEVMVTADDRSMTYGDSDATPAEGVTYAGFIPGEDESVVTGTGSITYTYKDGATVVEVNNTLGAGSYSIVPGIGGLSATNYTFTPANGTLTVDQATMEVTSPGYEEYYDGLAHGLTASVTGLTGMTITYSDSATGTFTSASPEYTNAGTYTVYIKAVDPDGNYSEATGSADIVIHQVEVTVTADDQNMMYGDVTAPAETVTYSGFVHGENATTAGVTGDVLYSYYDSLMFAVAVSSTLDAGLYTITPDVSGLTSTNYTFTPSNGTLTVAKSDALTVEADDVTGAYDGGSYMVSPTASDMSGTDIWYSLLDSTNPADYSLTPPLLVDVPDSARVYLMATNANYETAFGSALVTITPVELTVTPDDQYMTYGDTILPTESSLITGYVNSENATMAGVTGTIGYSYFDGTTPVTVSSTLPAGDYTIEVDVSGLSAPNYTFTNATGALTVAKSESLTVDAADISEMYNGGTHMVTPLASDMSADTTIWYSLVDSTDPADYSTTAPALVNVGDSATVYLMATNPNYYPAFGDAEVDITTRVIALETNTASKVYDATALTNNGWNYIAGNDGFIGTQGFDVAYATGTITNVGFVLNGFYYELKNDTLTENYTVNVTEGTLTVLPRPVVIALDPAEKNSGDPDPAFTFHYLTFPGLYDVLPGTGVTVNLIRTDALAVTGEDIGVHTKALSINVVFADAIAASNYAIVPQNADFTIHPQVTYNLNTVDAVTGFPTTEWFDYLTDATIADATGVARLGYVLTGWTDTLTGDPIALGQTITGINRNYSLNAVWELMTYSIYYAPNTAMAVTNMPGTQTDVPYTSIATMSNLVPTRAGFTFVHWDTADIPGSISLDPGTAFPMPNNDVTFVAIWEPDLTPVYYHANGGEGGTVEDGPFATLTLVTVAGNGFTRPGYRFIGWSTTPDGGVSAQPGDTFMMPVLQVNYYAQWEQELYTVTYVVNGGTTAGLDGAVPYAEYTDLAYGDAMPVPADPAQDGYNFDGWTTAIPATVPEGGLTIYGSMTAVTEPEIIPEEPTPLAGASWALLNLILAIATALGSVLMLIGLVGKKRKEELEGVVVRETKKHPVTRLMTLLPAIGGIVAFILTENMKNPMAFVDRWTILMAVIAVLQIALVLLGVKKDKDVDPAATK